jgi:hypothetical protein
MAVPEELKRAPRAVKTSRVLARSSLARTFSITDREEDRAAQIRARWDRDLEAGAETKTVCMMVRGLRMMKKSRLYHAAHVV